MNILSPYGPQPLSVLLSFIGYHTVSQHIISLWEWRDSNPQCRRPQIYSLLSNRCSTLPIIICTPDRTRTYKTWCLKPVTLPFVHKGDYALVIGLEPIIFRLTAECFTIKLHQQSVGNARFELTTSCSQSKRDTELR